jgi:hypothetical protein
LFIAAAESLVAQVWALKCWSLELLVAPAVLVAQAVRLPPAVVSATFSRDEDIAKLRMQRIVNNNPKELFLQTG